MTDIEATPVTLPFYSESIRSMIARINHGHHVLFTDITWHEYLEFVDYRDSVAARVQLTFDSGRLEVMSTSLRHERWKKLLARFFETITYQRRIPILSAGNLTIKRDDLEKGFEPDECYYLTNLEQVRALDQIDFDHHPAPDLAIEAEYSRNIISRLPLYAAFGIREVWRCQDGHVEFLILDAGAFQTTETSRLLPGIRADWLNTLLARSQTTDETTLVHEMLSELNTPSGKV